MSSDRPPWRRRLKHAVEYAGLRFITLLIRLMPIETASSVMGWCWRLIAPRLHRHPRALANLALAFPEKSGAEREGIALAMWQNLGRIFAESFMLDRIAADPTRITDDVFDLLAGLKRDDTAIVFVSLHAGNWELVIVPALKAGIKAAGVYQRIKNPLVEDFVSAGRRNRYPRGLFPKTHDVGRKFMRIIRERGAVSMLADLRDRRGILVPFFGRPAPSTTFPAFLARAGDAVLVAARVIRLDGVCFRIEAEVIDVPRTDNRDADIQTATAKIQARFEDWIREYPDQWMWAHKRWG